MATPIVIDLSHWNTIPGDLTATARAGIVGVIHKASEGASYQDDKVDAREFLARDAGMLFGLYHFLRAGVPITKQVDNFMSVYKRYDSTNLLIAADYEKSLSDGTTPTLDELEGWLIGVEGRTGKKPIIYSGNSLKEKLGGKRHPKLNQDNYPLWLAQYTTGTPKLPVGWSSYWLWQYTDEGSIPGVKTPVDLNTGDTTSVVNFWAGAPVPPEGKLDFADAMRRVLDGGRVRRSGWNGKGMYLRLGNVSVDGGPTMVLVCMYTAQNTLVPWLASVTDMVAYDWEEVDA